MSQHYRFYVDVSTPGEVDGEELAVQELAELLGVIAAGFAKENRLKARVGSVERT